MKALSCKRLLFFIIGIFYLLPVSAQWETRFAGEWIGAQVKGGSVSPIAISLWIENNSISGVLDFTTGTRFNIPLSVIFKKDSLILTRYDQTPEHKTIGYYRGVIKDSIYSGDYISAANNSAGPFILVRNKLVLGKQERVNDFSVPPLDPNGPPVDFAAFKGNYVLVDFWATYCPGCLSKRNALDSAYKKYKGKLQIISVSLDKYASTVVQFRKEKFAMSWPQGFLAADWDHPLCKMFSVDATPTLFLLSPEGKVLAKTDELMNMGINNVLNHSIKP